VSQVPPRTDISRTSPTRRRYRPLPKFSGPRTFRLITLKKAFELGGYDSILERVYRHIHIPAPPDTLPSQVRHSFASGGIILRLWECSLPECMQTDNFDSKRSPESISACARRETHRRFQPASLLRWDLPAAIFNGGRCTRPSASERANAPDKGPRDPDRMDENGFRVSNS
jgi:hypothetical protein